MVSGRAETEIRGSDGRDAVGGEADREADGKGTIWRQLEAERGKRKERESPGQRPADHGGTRRRRVVDDERDRGRDDHGRQEQCNGAPAPAPGQDRAGKGHRDRRDCREPEAAHQYDPDRGEHPGDRLVVPGRIAAQMNPVVSRQERHPARGGRQGDERDKYSKRHQAGQAGGPEVAPETTAGATHGHRACGRQRSSLFDSWSNHMPKSVNCVPEIRSSATSTIVAVVISLSKKIREHATRSPRARPSVVISVPST